MGERAPLIDPRAVCVSSGQVCVGKVALLETLAENRRVQGMGPDIEFPVVDDEDSYNGEEMYPRSTFMGMGLDTDSIKGDIKLREYDIYAKRLDCIGPQNNDCPTRVHMENSEIRTNILTAIRTVFKRF
jgi:hypothetical protein